MNYKEDVYKAVKKILKGKVSNYGIISEYINRKTKKLKNKKTEKFGVTPRMVGYALHHNPDPEHIPCHRVVDRNGKLTENFAFGGWKEQRRLLLKEGVTFRDERHVDLRNMR